MSSQREILRCLATEYAEIAYNPVNVENQKLYRAVNGLRMIRPVVLIDEEPWSELNTKGELNLLSTDEDLRSAELYMRRMLYKWNHHRADMIVPPFIPVRKIISGHSGWLSVKEETIATDRLNNIVSHEYKDQLRNPEDIEKLTMPQVNYDKKSTEKIRNKINEFIGDIIPARIIGHNASICPWDLLPTYRGVTNLLIDLVERPGHIHAIMEKMTNMYIEQYRQYEELGLFESEPYLIHCTPAMCDELSTKEGEPVLRKNIWGRGMAQVLATVSKSMHEEFEIFYQKRMMEPFGLVYYGCCEPLDKKIDIVRKIPHLRKISITPWADVNVATEIIGKDYVVSLKPNPANVCSGFSKDTIKKEILTLLKACNTNGCNCEIVLKDISTTAYNYKNLEMWERTVMDIVKSY